MYIFLYTYIIMTIKTKKKVRNRKKNGLINKIKRTLRKIFRLKKSKYNKINKIKIESEYNLKKKQLQNLKTKYRNKLKQNHNMNKKIRSKYRYKKLKIIKNIK